MKFLLQMMDFAFKMMDVIANVKDVLRLKVEPGQSTRGGWCSAKSTGAVFLLQMMILY